MNKIQLSAAALLVLTTLPGIAVAQGTATATVTGVVRDSHRQPVINAKVMIVDARTGTATSRSGEYTIVTAPGIVNLLVTARGYKPYQINGLRLTADNSIEQDVLLADSVPRAELKSLAMSESFMADQVDDPVAFLNGPSPAYPADLKAVGISGKVTLRFIVGTDGVAESNSIKVLNSTNTKFETPAVDAISKTKFRPAIIKATPVRQLVEQVVRFVPVAKSN